MRRIEGSVGAPPVPGDIPAMTHHLRLQMFALCLMTTLAIGCTPAGSLEASCEGTVDTMLDLSHDDLVERFDRVNFDEKYRWLICGNQFVHPPMMVFAVEFARLGAEAVAYLTPKLETAKGDLTIRDIVSVFSFMQALETYDVASDAELMQLLDDNVARISDPDWKRWGLEELERIRTATEIQ